MLIFLHKAKRNVPKTKSRKSMTPKFFSLKNSRIPNVASLFYLGGFILKGSLKSVYCAPCKAALLGHPEDGYAALTALKQYVGVGQSLVYPSNDVMKTLKNYEEHFTAVNSWCTDKFFTMKSPLRSLIPYLEEINKPSMKICMTHKERIS